MPTAHRSSLKVHSAAIRLTTSSDVNIDAIAVTSHGRYSARMDAIRRSRPIADAVSGSLHSGLSV
jgi:hypothetical protein